MEQENNQKANMPKFNLNWLYAVIIIGLLSVYILNNGDAALKKIDFTEFKDYVAKGYVSKVVAYNDNTVDVFIKPEYAREVFKQNAEKALRNPVVTMQIGSVTTLDTYLDECEKSTDVPRITRDYGEKKDYMTALFWNLLPFILIIFFWVFMMRRMGNGAGGGGGVFNVGRSKAQLVEKSAVNRITFKDVAGQAEAKQEVKEIVDFLKNPQKYTELGGKIPKGALLVGPPGTGKTLLAKAVAGEASVPFFSLSGSDFVEMFVGVGASRVRDLFRQAKEKAPCIIFIDEIDAVGRARSKNPNMGGNDERESTLNQLLTEMDGFGTNSGIIILAATNRADILDKALLRAGRFDRQIHVDLPDLNERKEVFAVHLRPIKIDKTVDVDLLARQTPGFSGADIANVCNEAALIAARHDKEYVGKQDFLDAVDRIVGGLEKKTKVMTQEEKHTIALHEAGHATLSWFLEHANPLIKVTIVPRGRALGAAWYLPEERQITTKEQMLDEMCATLGGRAAEELFVGKISTGAMNDLERVTKQAYGMIAYAGMSDKLPNLCYYDMEDNYFTKPYSDSTAQLIDSEVKRMIQEQYDRAKAILKEHQEGHNKLAQLLMEREVIFAEDVEQIFGKRPWASRSEEILASDDPKPSDTKAEQKPDTGNDALANTTDDASQANVADDAAETNTAEKAGELKAEDEKIAEEKVADSKPAERTLFDEETNEINAASEEANAADGNASDAEADETTKPAEASLFDEKVDGNNAEGEETNAADGNASDEEADETTKPAEASLFDEEADGEQSNSEETSEVKADAENLSTKAHQGEATEKTADLFAAATVASSILSNIEADAKVAEESEAEEADEKGLEAPAINADEESSLAEEAIVADESTATKVAEDEVAESNANEETTDNKSADEVEAEENFSEPAKSADTTSAEATLFDSKAEENANATDTEEMVASEESTEEKAHETAKSTDDASTEPSLFDVEAEAEKTDEAVKSTDDASTEPSLFDVEAEAEKTDEAVKSTDAASTKPSLFDVEAEAEKTDEAVKSTDAASTEPSLFNEKTEDINDSKDEEKKAEETKTIKPHVIEAYTPKPFVLPHWTAWPEDDEPKSDSNEAKRPADLWKRADTTKSSDNAKSADDANVSVTVTENSIEWKFPEVNAAEEGPAEESNEATANEAETADVATSNGNTASIELPDEATADEGEATCVNASESFIDEVAADEAFMEVTAEEETELTDETNADEESAEDNILWNGSLFDGTDEKDEDEARFAEMANAMEEAEEANFAEQTEETNIPEQTDEATNTSVTEGNEVETNLTDETNAEEEPAKDNRPWNGNLFDGTDEKPSNDESAEEPIQGTIDFGTDETKPADETKTADEKPTEVKSVDFQTTIDWGFFEDEMSNETADTAENTSTEGQATATAPEKSAEGAAEKRAAAEKAVNQKIVDGEAVQVNE